MRVFNLAEELEKERKKNIFLQDKIEKYKKFNKEYRELSKELYYRIDKAIEYIEAVGVLPRQIDSFVLLEILKGDNNE